MNKYATLSSLSMLLIFCIISQPYIFAYNNQIFEIHDELNCLVQENPEKIIIQNPYEIVNFSKTKYYKANLHTHTTESDGSSSPSDVIYHYHIQGNYSILAITDHNTNTWPWNEWIVEEPSTQSDSSAYYPDLNMLAISGNEMSLGHHRGSLLNSYSGGGLFKRITFWLIEKQQGLSIFNHPGRYNYNVDWYQQYFNNYRDCIVGIEVYNQGDRYSNDRILWDRINKEREADDLIWGFSNDDMHNISIHAFRNYQYFLMDDLTEEAFRNAMIHGSFYFSYEPNGSNCEDPCYGKAMTPKIRDIELHEQTICIISENVESIYWYNDNSQIVGMNNCFNVSFIDSNFVRAVLINEYGKTYTQPFGIIRN